MPNFNQTGPLGQGPMTGRRMGRCTNFGLSQKSNETPDQDPIMPDATQPFGGRGRGFGPGRRGRGRGFGQRNRFRGGV